MMTTVRLLRVAFLLLIVLAPACAGPSPLSPLVPTSPLLTPAEGGTPSPMPRMTLTPTAERAMPSPAPAIDAVALLRERCTACHTLARVETSRKTAEEWEQTIVRMMEYGARLTEDEKLALIAYLVAQYGR